QDREIYWVNNRKDSAVSINASFRIAGKIPQIWHPESGLRENVSYTISGGITKVELNLLPNDAVFVVFKDNAVRLSVKVAAVKKETITTIKGNWKVSFPSGWGAPALAGMDSLSSWTSNPDKGIKYFSGTAVYTKLLTIPAKGLKKGSATWLDLGEVKDIAEVSVNGKPVGVLWKQPFMVDISKAIKPGQNTIEIKVTNSWVNRLIGDAQTDAAKKYTYVTWSFYDANSPLQSSGLLGPVKVLSVTHQ
ncbi:MAG: glycosylhydrolase-like jelly roll fold domain-containing protein, partial [Mucilaginibacter sp.]|uniref:glycosylhydrolase-like jelly roll fold domain-containing protein n=1 Tax=Mucilaginibacter sp. TaxID=1882438 RepID=UPI0031B074A5